MKTKILLFVSFVANLCFFKANAQCSPPTVVSPVLYCQHAVAVPLTATGSNLMWGNLTPGTAGGTATLSTASYIDNNYSNRKLNFTTTRPNTSISSVDYYIPPYQAVFGLRLSIYNNAGAIIATSATSTSTTAGGTAIKVTNTFGYNIVSPGNYSIGVSSGMGNIGADNPAYPITEPTGTINITGGASSGLRCFNNIKFPASASATAPTPATDVAGTFNYTVTQTVGACTSAAATITVIITAAPAATISYAGNPFCTSLAGAVAVSRTGTAGGIYTSTPGLTINGTTGAITAATSTPGNYVVSYTMTGSGGCTNKVATTNVTIKAAPGVSITKTETCIGSPTGTIVATADGGTAPYSFSLNGAAYQASGNYTGLAAGNYTLNVMGNTGCITSNSITVTQPATSTDDQTVAGVDAWVGHMYDGTTFNNYLGQFQEAETFAESFGGDANCFNVLSAGNSRSINTESFSVKFRMNSSKKGLYVANLGSDDGARLTVDGSMIFNNWVDHGFNTNANVLMNLSGSSNLLYEFYENGGANQVIFENFTRLIGNTLTGNTSQSVCIGNNPATISGDVFAALPPGISLSATGYQWVYSTSPGGLRNNIAGATAATFTASTASAPFNAAGTYYVYRIAKLSSTNNISYVPYVVSNESNAAVIAVSGGGQWNGSVSTDWATGANWCTGIVPTSATDVIIKANAARMPEIITTGSCRNLTIEAGASVTTQITGTLNIAGTLTNSGTMANNGTTNFNGTAQQTFSGVNTFYNFSVNNPAGLLLPSAITVNNNLLLSSGLLNSNNYNINIKGNWTNTSAATAFTGGTGAVNFNGTVSQVIGGTFATRFSNLAMSNTTSVSLGINSIIQGNINVSAGTFDLTTFTANRETPGGTLTVANNAVLKIGGTNSFPANFTGNTLVVASTVEYYGTNQAVANQAYGNLVLSSASGSVVKTFPATAMTVVGNFSSIKGPGTAVTFTAGANLTVNGNVSIGAATSFNGAGFSHSMGANWTNEGIFNGNSSTVIFTGAGAVISGAGVQNFNNLTVAASLITFSNNAITLTGNLLTTGSGAFSLPTGGTLTMTGSSKTIGGFGISFDNLEITGSITTSSSFPIAGNLHVTGSFISSAGVITMNGAAKTITGAGAKSFSSLYVTGNVSTNTDLSISNALNVSGLFAATAGIVSFSGTCTLTGTASLFNTRINGPSLRLSAGSVLGVASALTIFSGVLDVTSSIPNTVNFNGSIAQNINAITYNNLTLSNGNIKTASGNLTVNNNISIGTGTTFDPVNYTHSIYHNWYNNGNFPAGLSTVQFLGDENTDVHGATTFNILTVNNSNASTTITLHDNAGAAVVNMLSGTMLTGTNTFTITNTRTGNGIILGHITRNHAFTTGVPYAFEGPDNTIQFSSVASVNSVSVHVYQGSITDFPYNAAISRTYDFNIPSGSYTASLRLHYEDAELNGNNEASLVLWNFNGSFWIPAGKSGNSTADNYVEQAGLTSVNNRWTCGYAANVAEWNGSISSDWSVADNWTVLQGAPSRPPAMDDVAVIGYNSFNNQPNISSTVNVKNIVFGSSKPVSLSMNAGGSLITGDIVGIWNAGNAVHSLNVNNQTVTIAGNLALSDGAANHAINVNIGTGNLSVAGSLWQHGGASLAFSGAGNLSIRDNYQYENGSFTPGTGTVTYNGTVNQTVAGVNYYNLTVNKTSSTAIISDSTNIAGNLTITGGALETNGSTVIGGNVTIGPGAVFENLNTVRVGGHWNNNGTYFSLADVTQVIFNGVGAQNISATTFNNLEINKPVGSVATLTGNVTLKGNLLGTSGTLDIRNFFFNRDNVGGSAVITDNGTLIIAADNAPNKFSNYTLGPASTVIFNGTGNQQLLLPGIVYGNIVFRNSGTKILYTPLLVNGNLTIENSAILNGGSSSITLKGNWVNSGTYLPSGSTLICTGALKTISGNNTFNKLTVSGSYTFLGNNTINELLNITSSGSLNGAADISTTMNGDLINSGILYTLGTTTFTGNVLQTLSLINAVQTVAITVNFNGTVSPVLNSTSAPEYGFLNINNTGGVNASVGYSILYGLYVGTGASFNGGGSTHNIYGYLNNNGAITSSGTINFLPATAASINLGSNFNSTGRVVFGGAGLMTVNGTPAALRNVTVSNSNTTGVTSTSGWTLGNTLTINAGSILNAAGQFNVAGNIDNRGVINSGTSIFRLNGTMPQTIYSTSAFYDMVVENTSSPVNLLSDVAVAHELNFIKGNIITANYKLIQPASGIIINAAQHTGWVNGNLQKTIAAGTTLRIFQTGDASHYTPVTLALENVGSGGSLLVSSISGDHPHLATSSINTYKSINRYWKFVNNGIVFTSCSASFKHPFSDVDAGAATATFGGSMYDDTSWTILQSTGSNDSITTVTTTVLTGEIAAGEICNKNTGISYNAIHYCSSAGPVSPVIAGTGGGVFSSSAGLTLDPATGVITPATSTAGEYKIDYSVASTGECAAFSSSVTIVIDQAPSATVAYAAGPYCTGGAIIQPAFSGTAGGVFSADNGLYIDPQTGNIDPGSNQPGDYQVTYSIPATGVCEAFTYATSVSILKPGSWVGASSENWFDAGNWLCGVIPAADANIRMAAGAVYYPVIDSGTVSLNNLSVATGASVKIDNALLKISGVVSNEGSVDASKGTIEFTGTVPQTISANTFSGNAVTSLIISNSSDSGLVLAGPLDVYGSLSYAATGKNFTTNDFLTLKSTSTNTARVGNMTGKTMTGNLTVERYINIKKAWNFLSVPTNSTQNVQQSWQEGAGSAAANPVPGFGTQITSNRASWLADGFDAYSPGAGIKKYDQATDSWIGLSNTNSLGIRATDGYMVYIRGDRTITAATYQLMAPTILRTKGQLYTGNLPPITVAANKKVAVGNPYPAPLDMRKLTKQGVKDFFYVWDPLLGGLYGAGAYQVFSPDSSGNYVIVPGGGSYGPSGSVSNYIPSGWAFFVDGDTQGGSVSFTENAKYAPEDESLPSETNKRMLVNLLAINADSSTAVLDGLMVNFDNRFSNAIDNGDAVKSVNAGENISTVVNNRLLIVEHRNISTGKDTVYLKVSNLRSQQYRLSIQCSVSDAGGRSGVIIDNFTNTNTPLQLSGNSILEFTVNSTPASYAANRFKIVFDRAVVLPVKFIALKAYKTADKSINIDFKTADETNTHHYELERSHDGTAFTRILSAAANAGNGSNYLLNDASPFADVNYYRIKGIENSGETVYSNIVKVSLQNKEVQVEVFPNPVTDGKTSLQLSNMPKGSYAVQLVNISGQVLFTKNFENNSRISTYMIDLGKTIATGIYQLAITGPGRMKYTSEVIIR